jgi:hypothetical protein
MGVTGDFAKLGQLIKNLQDLRPDVGKVAQKTAVRFAPSLARFLVSEFDTGTDPFGNPFKPLSAASLKRGRRPPPMTNTGKARNAAAIVLVQGTKDRVTFPDYLRYHISTGRGVLPVLGKGWPPTWLEVIRVEAEKAARELLQGGR